MAKQVIKLKATPGNLKLAADPGNDKVESVPVKIVKETDSPIGWKEKIGGAYKAIIALVGTLLVLATQLQYVTPFIPEQYRTYVGIAITVLTGISTFLKDNQHWVNDI